MPEDSEVKPPALGFALLLIGRPKTFKTTMSMQFPNCGIIDRDGNLSGPMQYLKETGKYQKFKYSNIAQERQPDGSYKDREPEKKWEFSMAEFKLMAKDPWIKTIVDDGLSLASDNLIDHIVSQKGKNNKMTIEDWQPYRNLLTKYIVAARSTGKLFVMTAHEEYNKDERLGTIMTTINIPSKLAYNLDGFFSDVWRSEVNVINGEARHQIRCLPRPEQALGNSLGMKELQAFDWEDVRRRLIQRGFQDYGTTTPTPTK